MPREIDLAQALGLAQQIQPTSLEAALGGVGLGGLAAAGAGAQTRKQKQSLLELAKQLGLTGAEPQNMNELFQAAHAKAALTTANASALKAANPPVAGSTLTPEEATALGHALSSGKLRPAQMTSRGPKMKYLAQQFMVDPNFDASQADIEFGSGMTRGKAQASVQGGKGQEVGAMAGTIEDTMDALQPLLTTLAPSQVNLLNSAYQKGLSSVNDEQVNKALTLLGGMTALQATILHNGGTPTDSDMKLAQSYIRPGLNPAGFAGMRSALQVENRSRVKRLQGQGFNEPSSSEAAPKTPPGRDAAANAIRSQFRAGQITRDQAKAKLSALGMKQ